MIQCKVCKQYGCFTCDYDKQKVDLSLLLGQSDNNKKNHSLVETNITLTNPGGDPCIITKTYLDQVHLVRRIHGSNCTEIITNNCPHGFVVLEDFWQTMYLLSWLRNQ